MVKIQHLNIFINITLLAWKYVMSLGFFIAIPGTLTSDIKLHGLWTIFYKCTIRYPDIYVCVKYSPH